jgi:uncharacterized membrane protein
MSPALLPGFLRGLELAVGQAAGVSGDIICVYNPLTHSTNPAAFARRGAVYLAVTEFGIGICAAAAALDISKQAASKLVQRAEKRLLDPRQAQAIERVSRWFERAW